MIIVGLRSPITRSSTRCVCLLQVVSLRGGEQSTAIMIIKDSSRHEIVYWVGEIGKGRQRAREEVFVLESDWGRSSGDYRESLTMGMEQCENEGVGLVHSVMSHGNDEVEDMLLEDLNLTSFPAFLKFNVRGDSAASGDAANRHVGELSVSHLDGAEWKVLSGCKKSFLSGIVQESKKVVNSIFQNEEDVGLLFVGGDRSSVGKTSCCLGLLANLTDVCGIPPEDLGYIKPVTQCEAEQPIIKYCSEKGIECVGIGPVVFFKGFTRAYLAGETPSGDELVSAAVSSVMSIKKRRKFVLVDGVGYPAVGSICGISNANTAAALKAPVLLIGKSGVGDAVDSHNINSTFFEYHGVNVLGAIFNKMATSGYYNITSCSESINAYFSQHRKSQTVYGYLPEMDFKASDGSAPAAAASKNGHSSDSDAQPKLSEILGDAFEQHVAMSSLMRDVLVHQKMIRNSIDSAAFVEELRNHSRVGGGRLARMSHLDRRPLIAQEEMMETEGYDRPSRKRKADSTVAYGSPPPQRQPRGEGSVTSVGSKPSKSREEIEKEAKSKGASGG